MRTQPLRWRTAHGAFDGATDGRAPVFVLYFGPNAIIAAPEFQAALKALAPLSPRLGCATGTAICGVQLIDEHAYAVAGWLSSGRVRLASAPICNSLSREAGAQLAADLNGPDLAGVVLLCDSLNVDGIDLVEGLRGGLRPGVVIAGGLASDGTAFKQTIVGAGGPPREKLVGALAFYGPHMVMSQGCAHGWDVFGPERRITQAQGLELFELDGAPALDLYERYLGAESQHLPGSALRFPLLITNPHNPAEQVVRTVLNVDRAQKSMTFASPIPVGWTARLMRGAFDHLTEGARDAGVQAARGATTASDGLAFLVSCVGRRIVMGQETPDEVEAVAEAIPPGLLQFGFYSHGEISTVSNDASCGLHNQTMTVLTIQEAA